MESLMMQRNAKNRMQKFIGVCVFKLKKKNKKNVQKNLKKEKKET